MTCVTNGQSNGPCGNWTFNANNQISNSGYTYDAAGNLTNDGMHTYQWDAENHLKSINNGTHGTFTYNAYGWRVYTSNGSLSQVLGAIWENADRS